MNSFTSLFNYECSPHSRYWIENQTILSYIISELDTTSGRENHLLLSVATLGGTGEAVSVEFYS